MSNPTNPADLTVLLDAPALPTRDGIPQGSHAPALAESLDWASQRQREQPTPVVVVRRGPDPDADQLLAQHRAKPNVLQLPACRLGVDPEGWLLSALRTRFVLALHPGVVPQHQDSQENTVTLALQHLQQHRHTAALTGHVQRADGGSEAHPLPGALHRGAALLRTKALRRDGGLSRLLPPGGAADLDLTCRLLRTGYRTQRADNLRFVRRVWPATTIPSIAAAAGALRDALIVIDRYFSRPIRRILRHDALAQAAAFHEISAAPGTRQAFARAMQQARRAADWERKRGRSVLPAAQLERLLGWDRIRQAVVDWSVKEHPRRVVLAGWHPHLYASFHAARRVGLTITAIAQDVPVPAGSMYRGVPVLPLRDAIDGRAEGVIISDLHPATADDTARRVAERFNGPVLSLWKPRLLKTQQREKTSAPFTPRLAA